MKCFYHKDLDGKCAGAIVKMNVPQCEMIGINYGEPFPWDSIKKGETVYMVDFCLQPFEDMKRLNQIAHLIWIDHHKSAIEEAAAHRFVPCGDRYTLVGYSGCELAWRFFNGDREFPRAVHLIGRYDVWQWENTPGSLEFVEALPCFGDECLPDQQEFWQSLFVDNIDHIVSAGRVLIDYNRIKNAEYMKAYAFEAYLDGIPCICVNRAFANSISFRSVWNAKRHDVMLSFCHMKSGGVTVSLYSDKQNIDVSEIAKRYGGGGHKGAAGFQCCNVYVGKGKDDRPIFGIHEKVRRKQ